MALSVWCFYSEQLAIEQIAGLTKSLLDISYRVCHVNVASEHGQVIFADSS